MPLHPDIDNAMIDPAGAFGRPARLLERSDIDRQTKLEILRRWELDSQELQVAESENMGGGEPSLLGEVRQAIDTLSVEETERAPATRPSSAPSGRSSRRTAPG